MVHPNDSPHSIDDRLTLGSLPLQDLAADGTAADLSERWLADRRSFLLAGLIGLGGCKSWNFGASQAAVTGTSGGDKTPYVSTMTRVWGAAPARIDGVGMVSELTGTGSAPAPTRFRAELMEDLRLRNVPEPNKLLSENWTSLVLLQGALPGGSRKGTLFDVFIGLEPGSTTTSLEGGFLMPARLTPIQVQAGKVLQGSLAGTATGPVVVNALFDGPSRGSQVAGLVPGGGRSTIQRQIGLQTADGFQTIRDAVAVTTAINGRFNFIVNSQRQPVANAKSDRTIDLEVPEIYRSNINRYLHVIRNLAVTETPTAQVSRLENLEQMLQDPTTTEVASLRLEALGEMGVAILERALRHGDPKVRFMAAMALVYQEKPIACEELGRLAEDQWAFRWHALTALAAIPHPAGKGSLRKLLHARSVETRYGAVTSLVQDNLEDEEVMVEMFGPGASAQQNFSVKTVFSTAEPIVHLARYKSPEIVIFNPDQSIRGDFHFVEVGWTIHCGTENKVQIKKFQADGRDQDTQCSARLGDVLRCLGQLNATYSFVVKFLQQAATEQALEGRLVINALPKSERAYDPAVGNQDLPEMFQTDLQEGEGSLEEVVETDEAADDDWTISSSDTATTADDSSSEKDNRSASRFKWPWQ